MNNNSSMAYRTTAVLKPSSCADESPASYAAGDERGGFNTICSAFQDGDGTDVLEVDVQLVSDRLVTGTDNIRVVNIQGT